MSLKFQALKSTLQTDTYWLKGGMLEPLPPTHEKELKESLTAFSVAEDRKDM